MTPTRPTRLRAARAAAARTTTAALVVAVLSSCTATPGQDSTQEPAGELRIGPLNTQNTLTLATDAGLVAEAVTAAGGTTTVTSPFPAFAPAAEAMGAGQIDVTTASTTAVVPALAQGTDVVVFAVEVNDGDSQGIVSAPGTGITTVADLAGARVAVNAGGTGEYLLRQALQVNGMDVDDVEMVFLSPPDAATAFVSGHVDAWATWDQYLVTAARAEGAHVVALARDVEATNRTVHVVDGEVWRTHPGLVVAAYWALVEQAEAIIEDPELLVQAYIAAGAEEDVAREISQITPPRVVPAHAGFAAELQQVADFYRDQGMVTESIDATLAAVDVTDPLRAATQANRSR
ncbi:NrtA/SsuA/CpmA family ABC transporter substrate-binding protein [Cellulomonas bogoriensis]|uniref:NrtA/SsuA/CpmA family ABC transporter substrate-binding protein n=1 Tax=Cellulomonas bogoriensis TaxID=301388 RepID=UPI000B2B9529|nr:NrtA/SsuA/CpmA family ABC transporter substrate-binding protein [Cellulomonas bogoriensis]